MKIANISSCIDYSTPRNNPNFGQLYIEPSRKLVKTLSWYSTNKHLNVAYKLGAFGLGGKLKDTQFLHGNIALKNYSPYGKVPRLQVVMSKKLNLPKTGAYKITNEDGSKAVCSIINNKRTLTIHLIDKSKTPNDSLMSDNAIELYNGHIKNGYRVFDIKDNCKCYHDIKNGNEFFPVQYGELFANRIVNIDNLLQKFHKGQATQWVDGKDEIVDVSLPANSSGKEFSNNNDFWNWFNYFEPSDYINPSTFQKFIASFIRPTKP